ncbi:MAG: hypothetical protein ABR521_14500 [Gaiellaceae bacterium]
MIGTKAYVGDGAAARLTDLPAAEAERVSLRSDGQRALLLRRVRLCTRQPCVRYGYTGAIVDWQSGRSYERPMYVADADWLASAQLVAISGHNTRLLLTLPASGCCGRVFFADDAWIFLTLSVSPDGETVAVSAIRASGSGAYILLVSRGTKEVRLLRPLRRRPPFPYHYTPQWSPDGRWLVLVERRPGDETSILAVARAVPDAPVKALGVAGSSPTWGER